MAAKGVCVLESLEQVSEAHGDPTALIYKTLFASNPELEPLFVLDTDGSVRGAMVQHVFECILDYCDGDQMASNFVSASRTVHEDYGVMDTTFDLFFTAVRDTFAALLKDAWTKEVSQQWSIMLSAFATR